MMNLELKTQDLYLRAFEPGDVPALHDYLNHPDLSGRRYIPWKFSDDLPLALKHAQEIYEKWSEEEEEVHLAVVLGGSGELIGHAEMDWSWDPHCPGVSLVIAPLQQRKGYGSQVLRLLLRYLFESMPAHSISCWVAEWNLEARAFLRRHGFQESARMRRAGIYQGAYFDMVVMDLLRPEWEGGRYAAGR
jgi:RimJ/RimL family protein N-acetyltransferase